MRLLHLLGVKAGAAVADMAVLERICVVCLTEALQYRPKGRGSRYQLELTIFLL